MVNNRIKFDVELCIIHCVRFEIEIAKKNTQFKSLKKKTEYLHKGLDSVLTEAGVTYTINRIGSMISVHFSETPVTDFKTAALGNNDTFKKFFHGLLAEGVYIAPSAFETWFLTDALTYEDLDATIEASGKVAKTL